MQIKKKNVSILYKYNEKLTITAFLKMFGIREVRMTLQLDS